MGKRIAEQDKKIAEQDKNIADIIKNVELCQSTVTAHNPSMEAPSGKTSKTTHYPVSFPRQFNNEKHHHEQQKLLAISAMTLSYSMSSHSFTMQLPRHFIHAPGQPPFHHGRSQRQLSTLCHRNLPKVQWLLSTLTAVESAMSHYVHHIQTKRPVGNLWWLQRKCYCLLPCS